jgi:hypothetical protein
LAPEEPPEPFDEMEKCFAARSLRWLLPEPMHLRF